MTLSNNIEYESHKLSNKIAYNVDYVAIEDLNIKSMQRLWGRKISDYAFSEFVNILEYKTNLIKVDKFYPSSKTCSICGYVLNELDLKTRIRQCSKCKTKHLRDLNVAINICRVRVSTLGIETLRPV